MLGKTKLAIFFLSVFVFVMIYTISSTLADEGCTSTLTPTSNLTECIEGITLEVFGHRYYVESENSWYPVNTTIVANPSSEPLYDYGVETGNYKVFFKTDPSTSQSIKYFRNSTYESIYKNKDSYFTFQPQSLNYRNALSSLQQISMIQSVTGIPNGNEFEYPAAFGLGLDLYYTYEPDRLNEFLAIADISYLPEPAQYIIDGGNVTLDMDFLIDFPSDTDIYINGELWDKASTTTSVSTIEFKRDGVTLYHIPEPIAYDANGAVIPLTYEFKKGGSKFYTTLKTPYEWLNNTAVYPVYIDPDLDIDGTTTELGGSLTYGTVNIHSTGTLQVNATGWINITADDITVDATSSIIANGLGGAGGDGGLPSMGAGTNGGGTGFGYAGGGLSGSCAKGGGGAGFGGAGAVGGNGGGNGGTTYGVSDGFTAVSGSGGGGGGAGSSGRAGNDGGAGGGFIVLNASSITITGTLTADGATDDGDCGVYLCDTNAAAGGGGGSGGTILLIGSDINLTSGTLSADGGETMGLGTCPGSRGGFGGGGRVKIFYASDGSLTNTSSNVTVNGNVAGTIYYNNSLTSLELGLIMDDIYLYFNGTLNANKTYSFGQAVNVTGYGVSETNIYRDGANVGNQTLALGAGTYAYKINTSTNATGLTYYVIVNQSASSITNYLNGSTTSQTSVYPNSTVNITGTTNATGTYLQIWRNGTLVHNATTTAFNITKLGVGKWNFTMKTLGNVNFTPSEASSIWWNVTQGTPTIYALYNGSSSDSSHPAGTIANLTGYSNVDYDMNHTLELNYLGFDTVWNVGRAVYNTSNLSAVTEVTLNVTLLGDTNWSSVSDTLQLTIANIDFPYYTNLNTSETSPVEYNNNITHQFNSTWTDADGIDIVFFEWNGTNQTVNNFTGIYSYNLTNLSIYNYTYRWFANDTNNNATGTSLYYYNITKNTTNMLTLNMSYGGSNYFNQNISVDSSTQVYFHGCNNETDAGNATMYIGGVLKANGYNDNFGSGTYEVIVNTSGNENYTDNTITYYMVVTTATAPPPGGGGGGVTTIINQNVTGSCGDGACDPSESILSCPLDCKPEELPLVSRYMVYALIGVIIYIAYESFKGNKKKKYKISL